MSTTTWVVRPDTATVKEFQLHLAADGWGIIHTTACSLDKVKSIAIIDFPREFVEATIDRNNRGEESLYFCGGASGGCTAKLVEITNE
jgi:hypothetical protein